MEVGRNWDESIPKEIARSDFFILLLSEAANRSKFVKTEVKHAIGEVRELSQTSDPPDPVSGMRRIRAVCC